MHLRIYVYDDGPPPREPLPASLCVVGRTEADKTTDDNAQVTCGECLRIMAELIL